MSTQPDLDVSTLAGMIRAACLLECAARKPGNVHPEASFDDLTFEHFVRSAEAVAPILAEAASIGVTEAIYRSVEATRKQVGTNSNLGLILLIAPLAAVPLNRPPSLHGGRLYGAKLPAGDVGETGAATGETGARVPPAPARGRKRGEESSLESELTPERVGRVIGALTIDDTRRLYEAIRLARPGGMGAAPRQDLSESPSVTVVEAMALSADRDLIARQYRDQFRDVLETGVHELLRWSRRVTDADSAGPDAGESGSAGEGEKERAGEFSRHSSGIGAGGEGVAERPSTQNIDHPSPELRTLSRRGGEADSFPSNVLHSPCRSITLLPGRSFPGWELAVVGLQLSLLARFGDSLIARKCGEAVSQEASQRARRVLELDWPTAEPGWEELNRFDRWLREEGHRRNPGTTADLIGAILFAALRGGAW